MFLLAFCVWRSPRLGLWLMKEIPHIAIPSVTLTFFGLRFVDGKLSN